MLMLIRGSSRLNIAGNFYCELCKVGVTASWLLLLSSSMDNPSGSVSLDSLTLGHLLGCHLTFGRCWAAIRPGN